MAREPVGTGEPLTFVLRGSTIHSSCTLFSDPKIRWFTVQPSSRGRTLGGLYLLLWDRWTFPDGSWLPRLPAWDWCHAAGWAGGASSLLRGSGNQIIGRPFPIRLTSHRDTDNHREECECG